MPSDPTGIVPAKGDASTTLATEPASGNMSFTEALTTSEPDDVGLFYVFFSCQILSFAGGSRTYLWPRSVETSIVCET
jgi:hypothetical protein